MSNHITETSTQVLIVGAGPTGLTLACELARDGVPFRLIEATPKPQSGSRGKGVQPRSLEVFDDLGIVDRILAHGQMNMPTRTFGPDGQMKISNTETPAPRPDVPYVSSLITPEWRVEETLRLRLAELGGIVSFDTALETFHQSDQDVVATVAHNGVSETIRTCWMVGCDGGHSLVRKTAGIAFEGETREEVRMLVADVQVEGLDRDAWHIWSHDEGMVSLCFLPSTNQFQFQAAIGPEQDPATSLANMKAILERRGGRTDIQLQSSQWASLWRANIRLVDRYREGRVFLAGDAAHIHSPAGGQGMNTGIQDAHNLAWKLTAVIKGASSALLDTYEAERRPIAAGVLALSNARLKEAIDQKGIPTRRDASTMQLGINYRGSELARDDRDNTAQLKAGDRAPDATGLLTRAGERRLFDLTRGGRFTLLVFDNSARIKAQAGINTFHVVEKADNANDVVDRDGHLNSAYGVSKRSLVLIRPDGYVGAISDAGDISLIFDYLAAIDGADK